MFIFGLIVGAGIGGAAIWYGKEKIVAVYVWAKEKF
jgi:hypothetical protein